MWTMAGLAAAAAVVLAVLAWPHRESPAAAVAVTASRPSQPAASAPTIAVPSTAGSIAEKGPAGAIVKPRAPGAASHRAAAPEVLVPRDQAVALEALVAGLSNGTIDPQSLATAPADASTPLAPAAQIDIVPIVIPPIEIRTPGTSGGESGGAIR
jgi:hypothetical protein